MHAVLSIDLKARKAVFANQDFIDTCRTETLFGCIVESEVNLDRHRWIDQLQMAWLVFLMVG